jgi:hypothetical protein
MNILLEVVLPALLLLAVLLSVIRGLGQSTAVLRSIFGGRNGKDNRLSVARTDAEVTSRQPWAVFSKEPAAIRKLKDLKPARFSQTIDMHLDIGDDLPDWLDEDLHFD